MTYMCSRYSKNSRLYPKDLQQRSVVDRLLHYDLGSVYKTVSEYMVSNQFDSLNILIFASQGCYFPLCCIWKKMDLVSLAYEDAIVFNKNVGRN